jgi:hypothetical protein
MTASCAVDGSVIVPFGGFLEAGSPLGMAGTKAWQIAPGMCRACLLSLLPSRPPL